MGAMQVTMIDENKYAETMTDVVLPALEQCCEEGWFDPSAAERSAADGSNQPSSQHCSSAGSTTSVIVSAYLFSSIIVTCMAPILGQASRPHLAPTPRRIPGNASWCGCEVWA